MPTGRFSWSRHPVWFFSANSVLMYGDRGLTGCPWVAGRGLHPHMEGGSMSRVLVISEANQVVLMSETVLSQHLDDEHSSLQFLERLAWAVDDAEALDRTAKEQQVQQQARPHI